MLERGQPLGYQHTVATTWSLALQRLQQAEPAAVDLVTLASFLAPDDLPLPLLVTHHDKLPQTLAAAAGDPLALADAVAALRRYSLIRVVADGFYVHRLLQSVIRTALDADAERAWAATAVRLLRAGYRSQSNEAAWPESQRLLPHVLAAAEHAERLDMEAMVRLWLLNEAAEYLRSRRQYRQAQELQEQALAGYQRVLGDDHPYTLQLTNNLAGTRWGLGDFKGAYELFEQAFAARRRVLGDDHRDTLKSMNDLAVTRKDLGDLQGARELHEQVLATRRRMLGDDDPSTLVSMNNLAETRRALGDLQGAHQLHKQTLDVSRRVLGDDHASTLLSMNNLAETRRALGDLESAGELHEQALTSYRRVLGDDHSSTLTSMRNLAATRWALGDRNGARELYEQAHAGSRRLLGHDHPDTVALMNHLAAVRRKLGEL